MTKKIIDVISLASVTVFLGVALWLAIRGEGPRVPGHWSVEAKIVVWDGAVFVFGFSWLIVRYANAARTRFPLVFGQRGLLFYFVLVLSGVILVQRLFPILSKLMGG
jgi:hypothetical protein